MIWLVNGAKMEDMRAAFSASRLKVYMVFTKARNVRKRRAARKTESYIPTAEELMALQRPGP